jgi:hypothetical protein
MNTYVTDSTVRGGKIRILGMDIDFVFSMEGKVLFDNSQVRKYLDETGYADWITSEELCQELSEEILSWETGDMVYVDLLKSYVKQLEDTLAEYNNSSIAGMEEIKSLQEKAANLIDNPQAVDLIYELIAEKRKGEKLKNELLQGWLIPAIGY